MRRTESEIAFTCPGCAPQAILIRYPLENPQFARLVDGLERPSAMLRRVGDWVLGYFGDGAGTAVACTRCGAGTIVRAHRLGDRPPGLFVRCESCGEEVWSALSGISMALPAVRELGPQRLLEIREERGTVAVIQSSLDGSRRVSVGFAATTFALLGAA
jgi:predicted RNA-binding Zn-ribbon protein involved in translation (DUF1610 family)